MPQLIGDLLVKLGFDARDFDRDIKKLNRSLKRTGRDLEDIGGVLTGFGAAGALAIGGVAAAAIEFESAFAGVRKTVDTTEEGFARLSSSIRELSKEIPVSSAELSGIAEAAGQLGVSEENVISFTRTIADLAVSSNIAGEEGARALAQFANITDFPLDKIQELGGSIIELGNNFATTEQDILNLASRLAGAGSVIGLSAEDVLGLSTALSSVGVQAEAGGTAFSKLFINVASAVKGGTDELEKFAQVAGLTGSEFAQLFEEDAAQALVVFSSGLAELQATGQDTFGTLEELGISGARLRDSVLRSALSVENFSAALQTARKDQSENNALQKEAAERYKTTESQIRLTVNTLTDFAVQLGGVLLPALQDFLGFVRPIIESFTEWANENPRLTATIVGVSAAIVGLAAVFGPLAFVIGQTISGIGALSSALVSLGPLLAGFGASVLAFGQNLPAMIAGLTGATSAVAGLASAAAAGAAAFGAWKLGEWLANTIEPVRRFGDAIADLILKIPGLRDALTKIGPAQDEAASQAESLAFALRAQGIEVERGSKSISEWLEALNQAAKGLEGYNRNLDQTADGQKAAADGSDALAGAMRGTAQALSSANEELQDIPFALLESEIGTVRAGTDRWRQSIEALTPALSGLSEGLEQPAIASEDLAGGMSQAAEAAGVLSEQVSSQKVALDELSTAYETLGVITEAVRQEQLAKLGDALATVEEAYREGRVSVEDYNEALEKYEAAVDSAKGKTNELSGLLQQISTIFTDFGRNFAATFFGFFERGDFNRGLEEQAEQLREGLAEQETDLENSLSERRQQWDDFNAEVGEQFAELRGTHAEDLDRMDEDFAESVNNRRRAFEEFVESATSDFEQFKEDLQFREEQQIGGIFGGIEEGEGDLARFGLRTGQRIDDINRNLAQKEGDRQRRFQNQLVSRRRDLGQFIADQNRKIANLDRTDAQAAAAQEARLRESIAVRQREFNDWIADQEAEIQRLTNIDRREAEERVAEEKRKLQERQDAFARFVEKQKEKAEEIRENNRRRLEREEEDLKDSIGNRETELRDFETVEAAKLEERRQAAKAKLAEEEQDLRDSLEQRKRDFESFVEDSRAAFDQQREDVRTQLADIAEQHRTVWGDIANVVRETLLGQNGFAGAIVRFVGEFLVGKLFAALKDLVDVILPGVGTALGKVFGAGGTVTVPTGPAPTTPTTPPTVPGGGAAGAAGSSAGSTLGVIFGGITAAASIAALFQNARQEGTLNAIEFNTRLSAIFLGARADGGILTQMFLLRTNSDFLVASTDTMKEQLGTQIDTGNLILAKLDDWSDSVKSLTDIRSSLETIAENSQELEITVTGGDEISDAIARNLAVRTVGTA